MGMPQEDVTPHGEMPFLYGGTSDDAAEAAVNSESTTGDGDASAASFEAYINRTVPGLEGDGGATNSDTQPLLDPDNI